MARITQDGATSAGFNDVTRTSRITGVQRVPADSPAEPVVLMPSLHWSAVFASVLVGLSFSAMLIVIGVASGLIAGDENLSNGEIGGILGAVGAWSVIALALGSFVGSFVGGRLARWMDRLSIASHALVGWGVATLLAMLVAAVVSIGMSSAATSTAATQTAAEITDGTIATTTAGTSNAPANDNAATTANNDNASEKAADALGGLGWGLAVGMLLSLVAAAAGWFIGSRRQLTSIEREDDAINVI